MINSSTNGLNYINRAAIIKLVHINVLSLILTVKFKKYIRKYKCTRHIIMRCFIRKKVCFH